MLKRVINYVKKRKTSDLKADLKQVEKIPGTLKKMYNTIKKPVNKTVKNSPKTVAKLYDATVDTIGSLQKTARRSIVKSPRKTKKHNEIRFPTPPSKPPILFPEVPTHDDIFKPKSKNELLIDREALANKRSAILYDIYNIYMDSSCPKSKKFIEKNKELVKVTNEAKQIDSELRKR